MMAREIELIYLRAKAGIVTLSLLADASMLRAMGCDSDWHLDPTLWHEDCYSAVPNRGSQRNPTAGIGAGAAMMAWVARWATRIRRGYERIGPVLEPSDTKAGPQYPEIEPCD